MPAVLGYSAAGGAERSIMSDDSRIVLRLYVPVSIESNVLPLAALQDRLGLSEAELKKIVLRLPAVLGYSIESNVLPSLAALQNRLGLSELKKFAGIAVRAGLSIESNVLPKIDWLQHDLGLSSDELKARLLARPPMLGYSLENRATHRAVQVARGRSARLVPPKQTCA